MSKIPILDNHSHLDPEGLNTKAVERFVKAGGTHLIVSHKPYSDIPITCSEDYSTSFQRTLDLVEKANLVPGVQVYATVGPYPVVLLELETKHGLRKAIDILKDGMELSRDLVQEGRAIAIGEVGRPHFPVSEEIWDASCEIMAFAFEMGREADCPVVLHTESANEDDHIEGILAIARGSGIKNNRIIKHFSPAKLADPEKNKGVIPSIVARSKAVKKAVRFPKEFFLETDYIDSLARPDAVLPPETVPNITFEMIEKGLLTEEEAYHIHNELPNKTYPAEFTM